jgi:hypothetical protein
MKTDRPSGRMRATRTLALAWIAVALNVAAWQTFRAASALSTGQLQISLPPAEPLLQVSRGVEPLMFHALLVATMILTLACLYTVLHAWRMFRGDRYGVYATPANTSRRAKAEASEP